MKLSSITKMESILETLLNASERAARIARSCCMGSKDEILLVAEKAEGDANTRFIKDFKTIADVLAQEAARAEIAARFPDLAEHVRGEECPEIGGVRICVDESIENTMKILRQLIPEVVAKRMAEAAHCNIQHEICKQLPKGITSPIDISDLGIWIDPIDATAEFIAGVRGEAGADNGLPCVTVLIGAYLRSTGVPVIGVINQPFFNNGKGRLVWGVSYGCTNEWGSTDIVKSPVNNIVLMSGGEKEEIIEMFRNSGWDVKSVPGAGHKLLKVAIGEAAAYVVSHGTTFRWDTCAPHAILRARCGDLISYSNQVPITYNDAYDLDTQRYCNSNGIIAYVDKSVLDKIVTVSKSS